MTEKAKRMRLCFLIAVCGFISVVAIYILAGIIPPQSVDYSGVTVSYDYDDYLTEFETYTDIILGTDNVTIKTPGTYRVSGELENGSIYIASEGIVHLIFDNASITCAEGPAIYVSAANKVVLTTTDGSENSISASVSGGLESAIYSEADITFNGNGHLNISSEHGIAVNCSRNVRFAGGSYAIQAKENAIRGAYSVSMQAGTVTLDAGSDAIKTTVGGQSSGQWISLVDISGGVLNITSEGDGINSNSVIHIGEAEISILCGGGSTEMVRSNFFGGRPGMDMSMTQTAVDDTSTKGLKADTGIYITGGIVNIDCVDDAIHSDGDVTVNGGTVTVLSNGDGLQGDKTVNIQNGEINVNRCSEGICGRYITVSGGSVNITASDDGINATNSDNPVAALGFEFEILGTGGRLFVDGGSIRIFASCDGLDANGSIKQTGGSVYVVSTSNGVEVPLDYTGTYEMTGGELIALGSGGMMAQTISESSSVCSVTLGATVANGSTVSITDDDGKELLSEISEYSASCLILASDQFTEGMTVHAYVNGTEIGKATLSGHSTTIGTVGGSHGGRPGNMQENQMPDMQGGQMPDGQTPPDMQGGQMQNGMQGDQMGGKMPGGIPGMRGPFSMLLPILVIVTIMVVIIVIRKRRKKRKGGANGR